MIYSLFTLLVLVVALLSLACIVNIITLVIKDETWVVRLVRLLSVVFEVTLLISAVSHLRTL